VIIEFQKFALEFLGLAEMPSAGGAGRGLVTVEERCPEVVDRGAVGIRDLAHVGDSESEDAGGCGAVLVR
jgi:hypothetical protein